MQIERLAGSGDGVGHLPDGRVVFVPDTAPGDRLRVRVTESRPRFARAVIELLLDASPHRTDPVCEHFGDCGGCSWQHIRYDLQVESKRAILRDALTRIGGFSLGPISVTASPQSYRYRLRTRLAQVGDELGYRQRSSRSLCAVKSCPVLTEPLEAALQSWSRELAPAAAIGERSSGKPDGDNGEEWELVAGSSGAPRRSNLNAPPERSESNQVEFRVQGESVRISPGVFFQSNVWLFDALAAAVCRAATAPLPDGRPTAEGRLLELFAGAGLLTLPLARHFAAVCAVESHPAAAQDLVDNLRRAALAHVEVRASSAESLATNPPPFAPGVIVLDPPRTGLPRGVADTLGRLRAQRIVYLSCDPATLARDLRVLQSHGYTLGEVEGFDLFPQTPHVEALAVLERD